MSEFPKPPERKFEKVSRFEIVDFNDLSDEERSAALAAMASQKKSTDAKWQVGAATVAEDGTMVAVHNDPPGPEGHAEMNSLRKLYGMQVAGKKRLKLLALAGAQPGMEVVHRKEPYAENSTFEELANEWMQPCAKCLEYIHDRTANVDDVEILSVMSTGQVMRTSLRSLLPSPHTSIQIKIEQGGIMPSADPYGK